MGDVFVEVRRTGSVEWPYEAAIELMWVTLGVSLLTIPIVFAASRLTYLLIFRRGWTLHITANLRIESFRYPSKAAALADVDRQRALAAEWLPPEPEKPVRLPTRGRSKRRPL
ncbi:hypothetical protein GCM10009745_81800 [Kribbella yunnanensis]|uniref:DUF983 domain-containing protein n=1 Tax=Kribbella yunnanensis TaxID=190194 RepID=A0ABP4V975_9ACTN